MAQLYALAYTRFSSDLQREESIEAQTRAITEYCNKHGYVLLKVYADRGISGTTDNRPAFQAMLDHAKKGDISAVIVHKYDRFARNRADSAIYRRELERCGTKLISVTESFDETPESIILQSVIEGYNEFYSKNLRREVLKGLKENALSARHTGGAPCLGYDVDKATMKLVINDFEADAVRLIFKRYLEGYSYTKIINELNENGYRTKRGMPFGKNSIFELLRNEKYTGVYVYRISKNGSKSSRHRTDPDDEVIRVEGGVPQIISKEDFFKVQELMKIRKKTNGSFRAKQEYLLSTKIFCGECGCSYAGNSRKPSPSHPQYVSYRCTKKNGKIKCKNHEINRDLIESIVQKRLAYKVFDEELLPEIIKKYNDFAASKNTELILGIKTLKDKLSLIEKSINNIINVIIETGSRALSDKLKELETEKALLEQALSDKNQELSQMTVDEKELKKAFRKARKMLESGTLANRKAIIQHYVKQVIVHKGKIVIEFNITDNFTITEEIERP